MTEIATIITTLTPIIPQGFSDEVPETGTPIVPPYYVVSRDITRGTDALLDGEPAGPGEPKGNRGLAWRPVHQIDVYQTRADEDDTIIERILTALHALRLPPPCLRLRVQQSVRLYESDTKLVHHAITVRAAKLG
jgi:hypothetical protein